MLVLIDTWWNVNQSTSTKEFVNVAVLIDTWWNVNLGNGTQIGTTIGVLIDTWWNVNSNKLGAGVEAVERFNRYMVECEFLPLKLIGKPISVLIDTWWNVN